MIKTKKDGDFRPNVRLRELIRRGQQKELAERLGITTKTVSQWVKDKTPIPHHYAPGLGDFFGVAWESFLGLNPSPDLEPLRAESHVLLAKLVQHLGATLALSAENENRLRTWVDVVSLLDSIAQELSRADIASLQACSEGLQHIRKAFGSHDAPA